MTTSEPDQADDAEPTTHDNRPGFGVHNTVVGGADQVVQTRDVHGDIHLHSSPSIRKIVIVIAIIVGVALSVGAAFMSKDPIAQGRLDVRRELVPPRVDLSKAGVVDWIHWGYLASDEADPNVFVGNPVPVDCRDNLHCTNRKQGAGVIGDYTPIGNVEPFRLRARRSPISYSWSAGTPTAQATGVQAGEYMGLQGNGFRVVVPAGRSLRTLVLYVGVYQGKAACRVSLSDKSASTVVDESFNTFGTFNEVRFTTYEISFRAANEEQRVVVDLTLDEDLGGGNITLFAGALR